MSRGFMRKEHGRNKFHPTEGLSGSRVRTSSSRNSSMSGRLPSAGIVHEGSLLRRGYNLNEGEEARKKGLNDAVGAYGYREVQQKLTALQVLNKHHREAHAKVLADQEYLRNKYRDASPEG